MYIELGKFETDEHICVSYIRSWLPSFLGALPRSVEKRRKRERLRYSFPLCLVSRVEQRSKRTNELNCFDEMALFLDSLFSRLSYTEFVIYGRALTRISIHPAHRGNWT